MVITHLRHWHGVDYDLVADFASSVYLLGLEHGEVSSYRHDRYAPTSGPTHVDETYAPPLEIPPGGGMRLEAWCHGYFWLSGKPAPTAGHGHVTIDVRWTWKR